MIVRGPGIDGVIIDEQLVARDPIVLIEILNCNLVDSGLPIEREAGDASATTIADHGLAPGRRLPRGYLSWGITGQLHAFGFNPVRVMPHSPLHIFDTRELVEV